MDRIEKSDNFLPLTSAQLTDVVYGNMSYNILLQLHR